MRVSLGLLMVAVLAIGCAPGPQIIPADLRSINTSHTVALGWSANVGQAGARPAVRFSPFVADQRLFAVSASGRVTAVDRSSGNKLWSINLKQPITAGVSGDESRIYVASADGAVFSIEQSDGSLAWQAEVSSEVIAAPVAGDGSVLVRSIDGRVVALEKVSGERRWVYSYSVPALSLHGNGRPLAVPDGYLVGLDTGRLVALRARDGRAFWELDLSSGSGRSEVEKLNDLDADVKIYDDRIYAVSYQGKLAQIDPSRGATDWSVPLSSAVGIAIDEERIYVTDEFDTVWAVSRANGETLWKQEGFANRRLTAPVVVNDIVAVGDFEGYLHLLSAEDGSMTGRRKVGSEQIMTAPVVRDGNLYLQDREGKLAAVSLN